MIFSFQKLFKVTTDQITQVEKLAQTEILDKDAQMDL